MTIANHPKIAVRVNKSKTQGGAVPTPETPLSPGPSEARTRSVESTKAEGAKVGPGKTVDRKPKKWLGPTTWVISSSEDLSPMPLKSSFDLKVLSNKELRIAIDLGILGPELIQTIEKPQLDETLKLEPDFSSLKGLVRKLQSSA